MVVIIEEKEINNYIFPWRVKVFILELSIRVFKKKMRYKKSSHMS